MTLPPAESLVTIEYIENGVGLFTTYSVKIVLAHPSGAPSLAQRFTVATERGRVIPANAKRAADERAAAARDTLRAWLREIGAAS